MQVRKYIYFRVEAKSDLSEGLIFSQKELQRMFKNDYSTFKHSTFKKVEVKNIDVYYIFGGRFADVFTYL